MKFRLVLLALNCYNYYIDADDTTISAQIALCASDYFKIKYPAFSSKFCDLTNFVYVLNYVKFNPVTHECLWTSNQT